MSCPPLTTGLTNHVRIQKTNMLGIALSTLVYGGHVALFFMTIRHYLWPPHSERGKTSLLAFACTLFGIATICISLQLVWDSIVFFDHNQCPECPLVFLQHHGRGPVSLALTIMYLALSWVSDGMLFYRVCVIFHDSKIIVVMSATAFVAQIVLGSCFVGDLACLTTNIWSNTPTGPGFACLSLSLASNIMLSGLIIGRLLLFRRQARQLGGEVNFIYLTVVGILVESACLYAIAVVVTIIALGTTSPIQSAFLPFLGQMQAIPPLLITVRALEGRAISREDVEKTISTVQFRGTPQSREPSPAFSAKVHLTLPESCIHAEPKCACGSALRFPEFKGSRPSLSPMSSSYDVVSYGMEAGKSADVHWSIASVDSV